MASLSLALLGRRRFLPLFATQFLGAFNDNLYRSAMVFAMTFTLYRGDPDGAALAALAAGAVFILPYFLFSSLSGQVADRTDKADLARIVKVAEIVIMLVGVAALEAKSMTLLMLVLFAMGVHSTIFGPIKYAILPQHLAPTELMAGTGLVEAGTFLAILGGQLTGGLLPERAAGLVMICAAVAGWLGSLYIPPAPHPANRPRVEYNILRSTVQIVGRSARHEPVFLAILGITWFFALGSTLTQQFVALVARLHGDEQLGSLFLGLFSLGVAAGSLLIARILRGLISGRTTPVSAALLGMATIDLGVTVHRMRPAAATVSTVQFFNRPDSWHLVIDLLLVAVAGGLFIVPLYALLQTLGDPDARSQDVAANNIVNAVGMVVVTALAAVVLSTGAAIGTLFILLGVVGLGVAVLLHPLRAS